MNKKKIKELRDRRQKMLEENRGLLDTAETEDRNLSAEEEQEFDRRNDEADALETRIRRMEAFSQVDSGIESADEVRGGEEEQAAEEQRTVPETYREFIESRAEARFTESDEYREAFYAHVAGMTLDLEQQRALSKGTNSAGGFTVPTSFERQLLNLARDFGVMRQLATVMTTDTGEEIQVARVDTHGTIAWGAEAAAFTASDEVFAQVSLKAYKGNTATVVSEELLTDSAFDLEAYLAAEFAERFGVGQNTAYVAGPGSGSNQPTGILTDAVLGKTGASGQTTSILADDLIDLCYSVRPVFRKSKSCAFVMNDGTIKAVRKLKGSDGQYIWQPALVAGQPESILGFSLLSDPDIPVMAASAKSVLFGDFSHYRIRDVRGLSIQRLNELYAMNGQVGFRAYHRTDGKLLRGEAVKYYANAAS